MRKIIGGLLVILEGGEGVGKTTQAKKLVEYYNSAGYNAKYFREPGGTKLAEDIRNMILYNEMDTITETFLMSAARNINIENNILPELRSGNIVVLDRFVKSTYVYQGKLNNGNKTLIKTCVDIAIEKIMSCSGKYPVEITLLCDPEVAIERAASDGHERNKYDVMCIDKYRTINDAYKDLFKDTDYAISDMLDTTNISEDEVFKYLVSKINRCITDTEY